MKKAKLLFILVFGIGLQSINTSAQNVSTSDQGITIYNKNPWYWQYHHKSVILRGGSDEDNLFQWTGKKLTDHLDLLASVGGNYVRNTMSDRDEGNVYAFKKISNNKYDLNRWNEEYWNRLAFFLHSKPRVIVMTDGEIDDHSSMIRFLLYTCDVDVLAIIETNSIFQRQGHSEEDWYEKQLAAYEQVYPNLVKHNPDYPSADELRKISFVGDEDEDHLKGLRDKRWELIPGAKITFTPETWPDTPGSDKIVEILLGDNPEPVYIQAWGGGNTAARAFYKLKTEYPDNYHRAISKVVMYNIWYQDGAGNYIEQNHPKATMIYCGSFAGTWNYRSQKNTYDFIEQNVKNNHGPLGALYPQDYVSEGDSPAFFYMLTNGLRNYEDPAYGGWGGRFEKIPEFDNVYRDAVDNGDKLKSLKMWIDDVNRDFQARMDWCVAEKFEDANHHPIIQIKGRLDRTVSSGETVTINATNTKDPDGDELSFKVWQYKEAGSFNGLVKLQNSESGKTSFVAPQVSKPETVHIIIEAMDNGSPKLKSYQRIIVKVVP